MVCLLVAVLGRNVMCVMLGASADGREQGDRRGAEARA
jgi:hypothetical protein